MTTLRMMLAMKFVFGGLIVTYAVSQVDPSVNVAVHASMLIVGLSACLLGTAMLVFTSAR